MKEEKKFYADRAILVYYIGTEGKEGKDAVKYFNKQKKQFKYGSSDVNQIFVLDSSRSSIHIEKLN